MKNITAPCRVLDKKQTVVNKAVKCWKGGGASLVLFAVDGSGGFSKAGAKPEISSSYRPATESLRYTLELVIPYGRIEVLHAIIAPVDK